MIICARGPQIGDPAMAAIVIPTPTKTNGCRRTCKKISQNPAQVINPKAMHSAVIPKVLYVSHIRTSVRYSWSVQA